MKLGTLGLNVALGVLLVGGYATFSILSGDHDGPTAPGRTAPTFELPVINRDSGTAGAATYAGRPVLLNFWASWCSVCKEERPVLDALRARTEVEVLGIATSDQEGDARASEASRPHGHVVVYDPGGVADLYGVTALPTSILVGGDGRIVRRFRRGLRERDIDDIRELIRAEKTTIEAKHGDPNGSS